MFSEDVLASIAKIKKRAPLLDFRDKAVFISNLAFMYQVIVASERLLKETINESSGKLKAYLEAHLDEEREHEKWLSEDLLSAGVDVKTAPLLRTAVEMAGSQYYLIKHVNPACLLGYMLVLEGFPMPMSMVDELESLYGKGLLRTVRYHAHHDVNHSKDIMNIMNEYPLQEVRVNAIQTAIYINEFSEELR